MAGLVRFGWSPSRGGLVTRSRYRTADGRFVVTFDERLQRWRILDQRNAGVAHYVHTRREAQELIEKLLREAP